jgi:hypothetical protein
VCGVCVYVYIHDKAIPFLPLFFGFGKISKYAEINTNISGEKKAIL